MKTSMIAKLTAVLVMAAGALLPLRANAAVFPDLRIASVAEYGTTARVQVTNSGMAMAGMCRLYAYRWNGVAWVFINQAIVPALGPGASVWVSVSGPGIQLPNTMYFVDATNLVAEDVGEMNNRVVIP
jgi:hypothetical protein